MALSRLCNSVILYCVLCKHSHVHVFPEHLCRRRGCGGCKRDPKTFDLVKIREKSLKIRAKSRKFGQNVWIPSQNRCMCFDFTNMAPKSNKVQTFFWRSCFYLVLYGQVSRNLGKNGVWSASIWKNTPNMKRNAVVFLEVIFFGVFFGQVWGNLGKNPSHPQKFACSYICVSEHTVHYVCLKERCWINFLRRYSISILRLKAVRPGHRTKRREKDRRHLVTLKRVRSLRLVLLPADKDLWPVERNFQRLKSDCFQVKTSKTEPHKNAQKIKPPPPASTSQVLLGLLLRIYVNPRNLLLHVGQTGFTPSRSIILSLVV